MTDDYLLGHDDIEWSRLREQHALWAPELLHSLKQAGLTPNARVLEVGCGTGELLADLAERSGEAVGLERDPRAAAHAARRLDGRATVHTGDLMEWEPDDRFDLVVARWVFCFLPDPATAAARLASWVRPGGALVIQDYNHDGIRIFPEHPPITRCIEGFRAAWRALDFDLWVAPALPRMLMDAGLPSVSVTPQIKAGPPGSAAWRWVERFLHEHIGTVVDGGHLSGAERDAFVQAWAEAKTDPATLLFTPIQLTVVASGGRTDAATR